MMAPPAQSPTRQPVSRFSALPGCYIFALLGCMVLGLIIWAAYTFTRQARALEEFTASTPLALPVRQATEGEVSALREKLTAFQASAKAGQAASVTLSVDELNTLLAGFSSLADVRPLLVCREIGADGALTADVSFPMNSLSGRRFLNGRLVCKVGAHEQAGLYLAVTDVQVPGKTVPQGFIDVYQRGIIPGKTFGFLDDMLLRNFRADPLVSATLAAIKEVASTSGAVTLTTKAVAVPAPGRGAPPAAPAKPETADGRE